MMTYARKIVVAVAVVTGMTVGSGTVPVAAGPQAANRLERGDSGGATAVVAVKSETTRRVPQGRYRIGFLAE